MSMDNRKPEDETNPENAPALKPEQGLIADRELETISGGIMAKIPLPPQI
jgi:hypothetical protein